MSNMLLAPALMCAIRDLDPECLEKTTVFIGMPSTLCVLLLASLWRTWRLRTRPIKDRSPKSVRLLWIKLLLLAFSVACSITNLIIGLAHPPARFSLLFLLDVLEPVALASLIILTVYNHQRTRRASTIALLFWPPYTFEAVIWVHSVVLPSLPHLGVSLYLRSAAVLFGLVAYALECLGPEEPHEHENPYVTANVYNRWTFSFMTSLLRKGALQYIKEDDLPPLVPENASAKIEDNLQRARKKHSSLLVALTAAYGGPYLVAALLKCLQDLLAFLQPQLLRTLLSYISEYQDARRLGEVGPGAFRGFAIVTTMFVAAVSQSIILHQYFERCFDTGARIRAGLIAAIYQKALILSNDERGSRQTGTIVNLMSVDATRLQDFCTYGLIAISGPFQIVLALVSLYNLLGAAMFPGVAVLLFFIPINGWVANQVKKMNEEQMKNRDKRTRLMNELMTNIKSIKLYAWEFAFMRRVLAVRNDLELKMLKKIGLSMAGMIAMWTGVPMFVSFASFMAAAITSSKPMTSDIIFPAISLFMLLQFPLGMFAQVMTNLIESVVSIRRLSDFLAAGELQPDARKVVEKKNLQIGDGVLSIERGEFWWSNKSTEPTLRDVNLVVKKGDLVGVLGRVGAGKSSLLSAIVGDMTRTNGELVVSGSVAYAPQDPWILSASVRDNILFHHEYDEAFYSLVLEACALQADLEVLPQGDLTEVGEKGITLSGGQRARVSLARAVYARADLVLLDDVLAAVDAHVARHLFDHVIGPNGLLSTKARIVATNSVAFLNRFDWLIFLRRGTIADCGTYGALLANPESHISKLIRGHGNGNNSGTSTPFAADGRSTPQSDNATLVFPIANAAASTEDIPSTNSSEKWPSRRQSYSKAVLAPSGGSPASGRNEAMKEHSEQGRVKHEVYLEYIRSSSVRGFVLLALAGLGRELMVLLSSLTLREWGERNRTDGGNDIRYVLVYGLFSLSSVVLGAVGAIALFVYCTLKSAKYFHDSALYAIMRAPLSFFEMTPTGRIMNLFSRDTYVLDQELSRAISALFRCIAITLSIFAVISWSFPQFLLAIVPLGWFYLRVMNYYLRTSRELKRLDAVSKSPIFAWFSESLAGVSTIRAFRQQRTFIVTSQQRVDHNLMAYGPLINANRWLALRLEVVGAFIILVACLAAMMALMTTGIDAGLVGLVLTYALNTTGVLNWLVRSASEVEQSAVSIERLLQYIKVPPEASYEIEGVVEENWPSRGEIEFRNYCTRYRPELDLVLKDISLVIKPREKIGVCGRTGAGKSSLLLSMLRIIEPASGTILIDGADITTLGLHDLRSRITIVPQSAELHSGPLRDLIDPLGAYSDADIWIALAQAHLKEFAESLPEGLDTNVSEGGSSLSSGQRQLLCFSRALLRKSKIIVLDEATSAVDLDTDRAIQEIIRGPEFHDVTMIIIAHRLNTILDSDRILVLSNGCVAELDSPANLLADTKTIFHSLVAEAGLIGSLAGG